MRITNYAIKKEYPYITITNDNNRVVCFDISKPITNEDILGFMGKPYKSVPNWFEQYWFCSPFAPVICGQRLTDKNKIKIVDALSNFSDMLNYRGFFPWANVLNIFNNSEKKKRLLSILSKKDYNAEEHSWFVSVINHIERDYVYNFIKECDLDENASYVNQIKSYLDGTTYDTSVHYGGENAKIVNLVPMLNIAPFKTLCKKVLKNNILCDIGLTSPSTLLKHIFQYCEMCIELNEKIETAGDFYYNLKKITSLFIQTKVEREERVFRDTQSKYSFLADIEDEDFKIIVPTTHRECVNEGRILNNCLGGYEWNNYLSEGLRSVIFIRRKTDIETPYIACDIGTTCNEIFQYLTYNNNSLYDDKKAMAFRKKIDEILSDTFGDNKYDEDVFSF